MREPTTYPPAGSGSSATESMDKAYADARAAASAFPIRRMPEPRVSDRLTAEEHWRGICSQLTAHQALAEPFLE